jgi:uncharacterized protein (DUF362 family)
MALTRREFIRQMMALGFSAATAGTLFSLLACGREETTVPTSAPASATPPLGTPASAARLTPTARPLSTPTTAATPIPTDTPSAAPSAAATPMPTDTPPATPSAAATPTLADTPAATPSAAATPTPTDTPTATPSPAPAGAYLAVARGESPTAMVQAALKALGGIERFVRSGDDVVIKPNIGFGDYSYEYAATTNPEVVGALTALCLGAGAKRVRVMDNPTGATAEQAYARSGIKDAVIAAGGQMETMSDLKFRETAMPEGRDITKWPVYKDVLDANVLINVPIAKHHNLARLTLGMKNLMGVITNRGDFHSNLGQRVADLNSLVRPTLTVVDAVRILMDHGPTGGSLDDVKLVNTVIASHDFVAADAYAATLFGLTGADIPAIRAGAEMGLGTTDLGRVKLEEISV